MVRYNHANLRAESRFYQKVPLEGAQFLYIALLKVANQLRG